MTDYVKPMETSAITIKDTLNGAIGKLERGIELLDIDIHPPKELGLRVDFVNKTFTRLGDAVGLTGGSDFDDFTMYQRRRCNLADDGTVNAYYGDTNYKADGSNGQVMVEQPKFYYKIIPVQLNLEVNTQLEIAEYWITDKPLNGYKLHPAFYDTNGQPTNVFYEGAYEGYVDDNNKLSSISGVEPTRQKTRAEFRINADNRGVGWKQETIWSLSADKMLMLIEYGTFNMQEAIGNGCVQASSGLYTGTLDNYGNDSWGTTEDLVTGVQWRGKENPWGSYAIFTDGINTYGRQASQISSPYISNNYDFEDDTNTNYTYVKYNLPVTGGEYINSFGYSSDYDWAFLPRQIENGADSALPIGDVWILGGGTWDVFMSGGSYRDEMGAGAFFLDAYYRSTSKSDYFTARLLFVG